MCQFENTCWRVFFKFIVYIFSSRFSASKGSIERPGLGLGLRLRLHSSTLNQLSGGKETGRWQVLVWEDIFLMVNGSHSTIPRRIFSLIFSWKTEELLLMPSCFNFAMIEHLSFWLQNWYCLLCKITKENKPFSLYKRILSYTVCIVEEKTNFANKTSWAIWLKYDWNEWKRTIMRCIIKNWSFSKLVTFFQSTTSLVLFFLPIKIPTEQIQH